MGLHQRRKVKRQAPHFELNGDQLLKRSFIRVDGRAFLMCLNPEEADYDASAPITLVPKIWLRKSFDSSSLVV